VATLAITAGSMVDIHGHRPVMLSPEMAREWLDATEILR